MSDQASQIPTKPIQIIPPTGEFELFQNHEHYKQKLIEWGLSTGKEEFIYKERDFQEPVRIKGYEIYGSTNDFNTAVIEFKDGSLTCIHPAYLKEMQQSGFGKESIWAEGNHHDPETVTKVEQNNPDGISEPSKGVNKKSESKKGKKEKTIKLELPADKVHFTATVKQFALTYNSFTEENDEVIILEKVQIHQEPSINLDYAWCSHSKTLKKLELTCGDSLEFDGKIAAKKLTKGKEAPEEFTFDVTVPYKINNPSKLVKPKEK